MDCSTLTLTLLSEVLLMCQKALLSAHKNLFGRKRRLRVYTVRKRGLFVMQFCKCGSMMLPSGSGLLKCRSCGKTAKAGNKSQDLKIKSVSKKQEMFVLESQSTHLPEGDFECPSCGHGKALWFVQQTRSSDEPPTRFFRCTKCSHTWREYQ